MKQLVKELKNYSLLSNIPDSQTKISLAVISMVRLIAGEGFDCNIYQTSTDHTFSIVFFNGEFVKEEGFVPEGPYLAVAEAFSDPKQVSAVFNTPCYIKGDKTAIRSETRDYHLPDDIYQLATDIINHLTKPASVLRLV